MHAVPVNIPTNLPMVIPCNSRPSVICQQNICLHKRSGSLRCCTLANFTRGLSAQNRLISPTTITEQLSYQCTIQHKNNQPLTNRTARRKKIHQIVTSLTHQIIKPSNHHIVNSIHFRLVSPGIPIQAQSICPTTLPPSISFNTTSNSPASFQ